MAPVGSVRAQQERPGPQALRQPARERPGDGHPDGPRCLHPPPGRRERVGGALRPNRRQRPRHQGHVLRAGRGQGLPPPDLLQAAGRRGPHVMDAKLDYVLRIADACLIHGQRLSEWCGHAPVLEEDIALTNVALDHIGQARALLTLAGQLEGRGRDEDALAFLREERDYRNPTLLELPPGDFACTVLRAFLWASFMKVLCQALASSSDTQLAAIAAKSLKEVRYHQQHTGDWVVRLGDGTEESARRMAGALALLWPYTAEWFADDEVDRQA